MERFFFKKIPLFIFNLIVIGFLILNTVWIYRVSVHKSFPHSLILEVGEFLEGELGYTRTLTEEIEEKVLQVKNRHLRKRKPEVEQALTAMDLNPKFPASVGDACMAYATAIDGDLAVALQKNTDIVHIWNVNYDRLFSTENQNSANDIQGLLILPDGSVIVNFMSYKGLARVAADGSAIWARDDIISHHSVTHTKKGTLWIPVREIIDDAISIQRAGEEEDVLYELNLDTGETIRKIYTMDVMAQNSLHGLYATITTKDKIHVNDIQEVGEAFARANPSLKLDRTDLIVSGAEMNIVFVFSPDTLEVKYVRHYPWNHPHDPDPLPDGRFLLFDNDRKIIKSNHKNESRILAVDPSRDVVDVLFEANWFYSGSRSGQELYRGNLLITIENRGIVMNLYKGKINYSYQKEYDDKRNTFIGDAMWLSPGFFSNATLRNACAGLVTKS